jgi:hypothetical protein
MGRLEVTIPPGLWRTLVDHADRTREPLAHIVSEALAEYLQVSHHTLYRVSTATALVEGIYRGAVRVGTRGRPEDESRGVARAGRGRAVDTGVPAGRARRLSVSGVGNLRVADGAINARGSLPRKMMKGSIGFFRGTF